MSACAVAPNTTTTPTKIPLMKWSQTRDAVHVVVEIRSPDAPYTPTVTFTPERVCVEATTATANYHVDAELYGAILPDKSAWRVAANGQLFVTLAKRFVDDDEDEGEGAADTDTLLVPRRAFEDPVEEHLCINPASRMGRIGTSVNFPGGEKVGKSLADGFGPLLFDLLWKGGKVY